MTEFKPQSVPDPLPQPGDSQISFNMPDSSDSSRKQSSRFGEFFRDNKWYIWAGLLGLVIIGVLAFLAFRPQHPEPTKNANVSVNISAVDIVPAGGEVIYKIQINNNDPAKLVDMDLELVYEDGIKYVSSTPPADNSSGSRFPVPDLSNGQNAVLMIKTTATGNINEDKQLVARLHYKFDNFSSEFTEEASHSVRLVAADIILDMTGPEKATNVQTANYDIFYRNDSDKDIAGARIQVTYPNEFKYVGSDPAPSLGQNIWNLNNLERNGTGKISFNGNFAGTKPGQAVAFKIEFLALDSTGSFFTQSSTTYMTVIDAQPLSIEQKVLNEAQGGIVKPGESIQYEAKFQNNTQVTAHGLNVVVEFDSKAIDPADIKADAGLVSGDTITWNAAGVPALERLNPGESGIVRFSVELKNPAVKDSSENITVVTKSRIKSAENAVFLEGNEVTLKVSSPSSIESSTAFVSGPLPPKVGQTTTLQVSVALRNGSNDYREGSLIGYIPLGTSFDKSSIPGTDSAAVKFDSATGKLTWTVGQLSAHAGSAVPLRTLKFNVTFTPTNNMANQPITLFKTISFTAKDSFTEQPISLTLPEVTTDSLPGEGMGRVQP